MQVEYHGANVGYGNGVALVIDGHATPLQQFSHPTTRHPLPWDWRSGYYGQWMVCYAILHDTLPGKENVVLRLTDALVKRCRALWTEVSWKLSKDDVLAFIKDQLGQIP